MTDAVDVALPPPDRTMWQYGKQIDHYTADQVRAYAIQAVMAERERNERLQTATEEAIASIEAGMHQGAADTLRAALWAIRAQPEPQP